MYILSYPKHNKFKVMIIGERRWPVSNGLIKDHNSKLYFNKGKLHPEILSNFLRKLKHFDQKFINSQKNTSSFRLANSTFKTWADSLSSSIFFVLITNNFLFSSTPRLTYLSDKRLYSIGELKCQFYSIFYFKKIITSFW